jgi:hypothetical protein
LWHAFQRLNEPRIRAVLIWIAAVFVPLCVAGNKQIHYLAPVLPPLFVLVGVFVDSALEHRSVRLVIGACGLIALGFSIVLGWWIPSRQHDSSRDIAGAISPDISGHPVVFFGYNRSLPLCFSLRRDIPSVHESRELSRLSTPGLMVIAQTKNNVNPPALPDNFDRVREVRAGDQLFEVYRAR